MRGFGVKLQEEGLSVAITGGQPLSAQNITIPGDISSAAFFLVAGAITPGSQLSIRGVGLNPTRDGVIQVMRAMGAELQISQQRELNGEIIADITVCHSSLHGTVIAGDLIPRLIDELPILAIAAAFASGETIIRDAKELRVKESDRIVAVCTLLRKMGAMVEELPDGMIINGGIPLHQATIDSDGDHRIAMKRPYCGSGCRS